jgi:hypothetical protein
VQPAINDGPLSLFLIFVVSREYRRSTHADLAARVLIGMEVAHIRDVFKAHFDAGHRRSSVAQIVVGHKHARGCSGGLGHSVALDHRAGRNDLEKLREVRRHGRSARDNHANFVQSHALSECLEHLLVVPFVLREPLSQTGTLVLVRFIEVPFHQARFLCDSIEHHLVDSREDTRNTAE